MIRDGYTTKAYQIEALRLMIEEANRVAVELRLNESLPITRSNIVDGFVAPFGFAVTSRSVGRIGTTNYQYMMNAAERFSGLVIAHYEIVCRDYTLNGPRLANRFNSNQVYQMGAHWLRAARMDVDALNRDCYVTIKASYSRNAYLGFGDSAVVPIYSVAWATNEDKTEPFSHYYASKADVEVYAPTDTLLQFNVYDPKYILRPPLVFTNLADLVGGTNILALTNFPHYKTNNMKVVSWPYTH